ncbi:glycoside hydrolase superfamily [Aspergillus karnatakaensis]|uniref:glycoside hydrolase family 35 protein n=1 Tax=Aspergillus karnatakaensis TaxID=1810916 RepID=UPI003CCD3E72
MRNLWNTWCALVALCWCLLLPFHHPREDLVTWDKKSLIVRGERLMILSGEFHPFRLPSPGLWLDVFQKIRALGFTAVSFYVDWALLEGEQGHIRTDGVFSLDPFFEAASEAGVYLIARPGPYINAETSGGGFPGWLSRLKGRLRSSDPDYIDAVTPYLRTIGGMIAKAQIHNGGPVILLQPENEYTVCFEGPEYFQENNYTLGEPGLGCLDKDYMAYIQREYRKAGVRVPTISNDAILVGNWAPGSGVGAVDIFGFDSYPLGLPPDPSDWSSLKNPLDEYNVTMHEPLSGNGPFVIPEYQGGTTDGWGGLGKEVQTAFINHEFARVFYKLNYGMHIAVQNLYMMFGGTNWGNLGYPGGYTSYDFGAAIAENRDITRERYSELKLQANFLTASPVYLEMTPENVTLGVYTDRRDLQVMRLVKRPTAFYVVHHHDLASKDSVQYTLNVQTSIGHLTIPQLGGSLSLNGRDAKIHVVDYDLAGIKLIYSTAEIMTWKRSAHKTVLVLYAGENERHEFALEARLGRPVMVQGDFPRILPQGFANVVQWEATQARRVVRFGRLEVHLLSRNMAYDYWVIGLPGPKPIGRFASGERAQEAVIVKAGYLVRSAEMQGDALYLTGDVNATTQVEVISTPSRVTSLHLNGRIIKTHTKNDWLVGEIPFQLPEITLPNLETSSWGFADALPELKDSYSDEAWRHCNLKETNSPRNLSTPTSLYASDYGFHAGSLIYRGHFTAQGTESMLYLLLQGGYGFGYSVWLNNTLLGSWHGSSSDMFHNQTLHLPSLTTGSSQALTILMDHMGLDMNFPASPQIMKSPRGILDYDLSTRDKTAVSWKITGNFGGERYHDQTRGPLNEGATFPERQGYHLPNAPVSTLEQRSPFADGQSASVGFYATSFNLSVPVGYDVPLSFVFKNDTAVPAKFRVTMYVNGWQFGKYVNHLGPQSRFHVPEGIFNYQGSNYLAVIVWSQEERPLRLAGLSLEIGAVVQSGYRKPSLVKGVGFSRRSDSY